MMGLGFGLDLTPKTSPAVAVGAAAYSKYRLNITDTGSGFYSLAAEFQLYSTVGGADQANNAGFTISASNEAGSPASNARDGNFGTYWATDFGGVAYPHILTLDMSGGTPITALQYGIGCATPGGTAGFPRGFTFEGWNGSAWVVLDTRASETSSDGALNKYTVP